MEVAMRWLARGRVLRGTPFDPFGYMAERRSERALASDYEALVERLCQRLDTGNLALALELARLPEQIRGYGAVKRKSMVAAHARQQELLARWQDQPVSRSQTLQPAA
jgi:indolepyruvate ferredoxin oxidoreductase